MLDAQDLYAATGRFDATDDYRGADHLSFAQGIDEVAMLYLELDDHAVVRSANEQATQLLAGREDSPGVGWTLRQLVHPDDAGRVEVLLGTLKVGDPPLEVITQTVVHPERDNPMWIQLKIARQRPPLILMDRLGH